MDKAVVYTRVSTDKEEQELSLEIQKMQYKDYCEYRGYDLLHIYADIGTGTGVRKRSDFISMLYDAGLDYVRSDKKDEHDIFKKSNRKPLFKYIVVKDQSRLSRNMQQGIMIAQYLRDLGVYIIFENSGVSTEDEDWKMRTSLLFMIAEEESRAMGRRISNAKKYRAMQGKYTNARLPLGYKRNEKNEIVIDEDAREIIEYIFNRSLEAGGRVIARELNAKGYKTLLGNNFSADAVSTIAKNKVYTGSPDVNKYKRVNVTDAHATPVDKDEWVELTDAIDPIISRELWERVQEVRASRTSEASKRGKPRPMNDEYFMKLRCEKCGGRFVRHSGRNTAGERRIYYMCANRRLKDACDVRGISMSYLDKYLDDTDILGSLQKDVKISASYKILNERLNKQAQAVESNRKKLMEEIATIEKENKVISDKIVEGMLNNNQNVIDLLSKKVDKNSATIKEKEEQLLNHDVTYIQNLRNRIEKQKEYIESVASMETMDRVEKIKHIKYFVVGDFKVELYYDLLNYDELIKEYNKAFPEDIINMDFFNHDLPQRMWRRRHKAARAYWEQVDNEAKDYWEQTQYYQENRHEFE